MSKPVLIQMVGLPRSGKSTVAKELSEKMGFPIVNRDSVRLAVHGLRFSLEHEPIVNKITVTMVKALLLAGAKGVVLDETNIRRDRRLKWHDDAWDTFYYHVPTTPETCKERAIATEQPDLLPVIDRMHSQFQEFGEDEMPWQRE